VTRSIYGATHHLRDACNCLTSSWSGRFRRHVGINVLLAAVIFAVPVLSHPFYESLGYARSKTQHVYTKTVRPRPLCRAPEAL
jgi:hypothetical protein